MNILGIRDHETRTVITCRELEQTEEVGPTFAAMRNQYPPPRYEVLIGMADSIEVFQKVYPRYRTGSGTTRGAGDSGSGSVDEGSIAGKGRLR